ncbi:MAG TPA: hypothetical protein VMW27_14275 [Thermoanaerobaculia bacterium]|nr:hypothetical protein [Thermoanaerobaculia bacterium]
MRFETWKRLTFALVLMTAAFAGLIGPVSVASATPSSGECASNQGTIIVYYDAGYQTPLCHDVLYPCSSFAPTFDCDPTPYTRTFCVPCPGP